METRTHLLAAFLRDPGRFVSGASLGRELGLSRVSVHHHLEQLRREGFVFSAIRNRGYRMESEPPSLHPDLLSALLLESPCPFFSSHLCLPTVDSTNSVAETELASGRPVPFLVVADTQTTGRGRRGRVWHSPPGRNLYLTAALRPSLPPARLQSVTLWLGLRLCRLLRDTFSLPVLVKWPNDLMLHDRKIAGMLTEARIDSEVTRDLVFGLGLNVNIEESAFPRELADTAGSLGMALGRPVRLNRLAHRILHCLADAFQDFLETDPLDELAALWPEFDYLRGQHVRAEGLEGQVLGIARNGALRLLREDGSQVLLHSGEVSVRRISSGN